MLIIFREVVDFASKVKFSPPTPPTAPSKYSLRNNQLPLQTQETPEREMLDNGRLYTLSYGV
jgi:hypothetical protein